MDASSCAEDAVDCRGPKRPAERAQTWLVQPRSEGRRSSKARRAARSSRMLNRFGGGSGSASRFWGRTPPGLGVLAFGSLRVGERRETGQLVEVGDNAGQHPKHTGAVGGDVFRLRIGLEPKIDHDHLPAVQPFQPLSAPMEGVQLPPRGGSEGRRPDLDGGRLLTWVVGVISPPLLAEPPGISRASSEPRSWWTRLGLRPVARTRCGRWSSPELIGFDDGPDPLLLSPF